MNNNIISQPRVNARELNQGGTSTSEVAFTTDGITPCVLPLPVNGLLAGASMAQKNSIRFKVVACGRVTGGGTTNITVKLYFGTSATLGSDTALGSTGAVAVNSVSANWAVEAKLTWDAISNKIDGTFESHVNNTRVAPTAITTQVTNADPDSNTALGFVVSGQFSAGFAANVLNLDWFIIIPFG